MTLEREQKDTVVRPFRFGILGLKMIPANYSINSFHYGYNFRKYDMYVQLKDARIQRTSERSA